MEKNNKNSGRREGKSRAEGSKTGGRYRTASSNKGETRYSRPKFRAADGDEKSERKGAPRKRPTTKPDNNATRYSRPKFKVKDGEEREEGRPEQKRERGGYRPNHGKPQKPRFYVSKKDRNRVETNEDKGLTRLNKYLANAGVCSRREADTLIKSGVVTINGKVVTALGTTVKQGDIVNYGGERLSAEKKRYILLNKPKGFITTAKDTHDRRTVTQLVSAACKERIYPVGRLDKETTGLLLLTNDGSLTKKLTHPKYGVKKVYRVTLDKNVSKDALLKLLDGVELDDGIAKADVAVYTGDGKDKREIGVELHSGKNRVIRRMFEAVGYEVVKLDRVYFAGLTKKNLPRGKFRSLTEDELSMLHRLAT